MNVETRASPNPVSSTHLPVQFSSLVAWQGQTQDARCLGQQEQAAEREEGFQGVEQSKVPRSHLL